MIDVFVKIMIAVFAVFGLYAFAYLVNLLCFENQNIKIMLLVDSSTVCNEIEWYLDEVKSAGFFFGRKRISAIVMEKYATEELLSKLEKRKVPYQIVLQKEQRTM